MRKHYHLIAIGGAVMHNLAITLKEKGHMVTGSDDEFFDPAKSRLLSEGLLPVQTGWYPDKINSKPDAIILGMHAKKDNPELKKALALGIPILSFPDFFYRQVKNKNRIVIAGSHGKTTITAMIMHVLKAKNIAFDYLVGAGLDGFKNMVDFSENAKIAIIEGDEYPDTALQKLPKFLAYHPNISVISGIQWDHINVFPTKQNYIAQFQKFVDSHSAGSRILINESIPNEQLHFPDFLKTEKFGAFLCKTGKNGVNVITENGKNYPIKIFGKHNMSNLKAAQLVCADLGISKTDFLTQIASFSGAKRRMEPIETTKFFAAFTDFAHAPSKVKATLEAVRNQYPSKNLIAFFELHTFSSLSKNFITEYRNVLANAHQSFVFFSPEAVKHKNLPALNANAIAKAFGNSNLKIISQKKELKLAFKTMPTGKNTVVLFMSSGNWAGLDVKSYC